jgi:hypothetical protein
MIAWVEVLAWPVAVIIASANLRRAIGALALVWFEKVKSGA